MDDRFDPDKDRRNIAKHRISLARAFEMEIVEHVIDDRYDYGEERYQGWGFIDDRPYILVFTERDGKLRPISLRKMTRQEKKNYAQQTKI